MPRSLLPSWRLSRGLLPLALGLLGASAVAQTPPPRFLSEPRPLHNLQGKAKLQNGKRGDREIRYNLGIKYVTGKIENPSTGTEDKVRLRAYVDLNDQMEEIPNPDHKFIAPLIYMKPGQTVRITLHNQLEAEGVDELKGKGGVKCGNDQNNPDCFNSTNLHSHGLWVSPAGNSDNVLLDIKPKTDFQYEYNISEDHPAGTYWYHPHVHGSTAIQVGSGMAGALIIQGDREPTVNPDGTLESTGDLDTLLEPFAPKWAPGQEAEEKHDYAEVLLFQQIPYACFDKEGKNIKTEKVTEAQKAAGMKVGRWICGEEDTGQVEDFNQQLGFAKWASSGRYTSINGSVQPTLPMEAGRVYRWRLIDAGVHESIGLRITRLTSSATLPKKQTPQEEKEYVEKQCAKGDVVDQFEVASDGLTRGQIVKRDVNILQPGYRSDVLFALPSEGTYCLYDAAIRATSSSTSKEEGPKLLGWVVAKGKGKGFPKEQQEAFITSKLTEAARKRFTKDVRAKVIADLEDGLKTTAFVPHKPFSDEEYKEMAGRKAEVVTFTITGDKPPKFQINEKSFAANGKPDRTLKLGTTQKWILTTKGANTGNHPFHIHVNPFQILQILGKDGKEIVYGEDVDYKGMKGAWKDTIFVKQDYSVIIATRYERYIGDFVLHCHILDHEDKGMMETIRIAPHDPAGNPVSFSLDGHGAHHPGPAAQNASSDGEVH